MTAIDLNDDSNPDLAFADGDGAVTVLLNQGDGTFADEVIYVVITVPNDTVTPSIAAADVNGDSMPELVVANSGSGVVQVLVNQGAGTFAGPDSYEAGEYPGSVVAVDLDGDGMPTSPPRMRSVTR